MSSNGERSVKEQSPGVDESIRFLENRQLELSKKGLIFGLLSVPTMMSSVTLNHAILTGAVASTLPFVGPALLLSVAAITLAGVGFVYSIKSLEDGKLQKELGKLTRIQARRAPAAA